MKNSTNLRKSISGALIGFAIGDAMGATTEFMTKEQIYLKYGKVKNIIGGGWLNLKAGEVTDDTQMMVAVARACQQRPTLFTRTCCREFEDWYMSNPKDVGGACRTAITQGMGKPPEYWMLNSLDNQVINNRLDLGNGAVMRALYPALIGKTNWAIQQGRLTHNNHISDRYIKEYCTAVLKAMPIQDDGTQEHYTGDSEEPLRLMSPTGHVENSVKNALYWASHSHSFKEAIIGPVNHGGDADTIAALTGGIAGAYWGLDNIPKKWIEALNQDVVKELLDLAEKAFQKW